MSTEPQPLRLGIEDIDHKYLLIERMGEGGMGEIYKARHLLLEEIRVIKTIRSQLKEDDELKARFLREARVATRLHHQNIATIHDLSVGEDGTACIVMEYIEGINLAERMQRQPPLGQEEVLEIGRQTLAALGYLHRHKILHRDISPDNIMLARDRTGKPVVKLIDLGIAKPLEGGHFETREAMFIGKVYYASPEQLGADTGGILDGRSDLYSLGVVLYEVLTGRHPIRGTDQASLIAGHLFHPPRTFEETDPEGKIPSHLRAVLMKALAKKPQDRYATAEEFAAALSGETPPTYAPGETSQPLAQTLLEPEVGAPAGGLEPTRLASAETPPAAAPGELAKTVLAGSEAASAPIAPTVLSSDVATAPVIRATGVAGAQVVQPPIWRRWQVIVPVAALVVALVVAVVYFVTSGRASEETTPINQPVSELAGIDFGDYKALVIGNDNYQHLPKLETAGRDAREIAGLLEDDYGFNVRLLLDVDRHDMVSALSELTAGTRPSDNLLIYYAGHGSMEGRDNEGYWQPVDALPMDTSQWISTKYEVATLLEQSSARHILVIADSCFSGSLVNATGAQTQASSDEQQSLRAKLAHRSRLAITSGSLQPVLDSGTDGHSVFAQALMASLEKKTRPFSAEALFQQLEEKLTNASAAIGMRQNPEFAPIPRTSDDGGGFYFVPAAFRTATKEPGT